MNDDDIPFSISYNVYPIGSAIIIRSYVQMERDVKCLLPQTSNIRIVYDMEASLKHILFSWIYLVKMYFQQQAIHHNCGIYTQGGL